MKKQKLVDIVPRTIRDLQKADKTLESLRQQETTQKATDAVRIIYKDDIMYRQVHKEGLTEPIEQLVLPDSVVRKYLGYLMISH